MKKPPLRRTFAPLPWTKLARDRDLRRQLKANRLLAAELLSAVRQSFEAIAASFPESPPPRLH